MSWLADRLIAPVNWFSGLDASIQDRSVGLLVATPSWIVLALALWLTPDPSGMGTHRQLGLSECTVLSWVGIPCPMCGMTTTFSHLAHLELVDGIANQPFGLVLFFIVVVLAVVGGLDAVLPKGRWRVLWAWVEHNETKLALGLIAGMVFGWLYKLIRVVGIPTV